MWSSYNELPPLPSYIFSLNSFDHLDAVSIPNAVWSLLFYLFFTPWCNITISRAALHTFEPLGGLETIGATKYLWLTRGKHEWVRLGSFQSNCSPAERISGQIVPEYLTIRASTGPGTGPCMGPVRGFQKNSGLRVLTGPGLQCILHYDILSSKDWPKVCYANINWSLALGHGRGHPIVGHDEL